MLQGDRKLLQTQQQKQHQQPHQLHQQQYQHLHKLHQLQRPQHQYQQQHHQQQQQRAIFFPSPSSRQQVFMHGQQQMTPLLFNIALQRWPSNFYQRFSTPFLPPTHYQPDPINKDLPPATITQT